MEVDPQIIPTAVPEASGPGTFNLATVAAEPEALPKKKRDKREPAKVERPPGKTLLPISKVQHIIKADKDIAIVAKEATFLICCAAEEFIKRFGEAAMALAERDKRSTLQYKDIATVVRKADEFLFLEEIIPWTVPEAAPKRKVKDSNITGSLGPLDQFMAKPRAGSGTEEAPRIIINEDGTMQTADSEMPDDFALM
ncbi:hypothetical protein B0H15DRAFT_865415 [Mycena belliarum]|uniref:Transcription factor CBF/NF-Y/archaeal histone domain-containing protein n=1 Tax=Mycena belliarum TaxID=1033014 RepID=A0AAD6TQ15_9AGAR|nr:hypothetical protein B0H15DRAFT_865415 [Mycena belliae]